MVTYLEEVVAGALHGAHGGALLKDAGDLWIHLDVEVALFGPLLVSGIDSLVDPFVKWLTNEGADDVGDVLAGSLSISVFTSGRAAIT